MSGIGTPETWQPFDLLLMTGIKGKQLKALCAIPTNSNEARRNMEKEMQASGETKGEKKLLLVGEGEGKGIWTHLEAQ